LKRCEC